MANSESAKKSLRQSIARREDNRKQRSTLRTFVKKVRKLADTGDLEGARAIFPDAQKKLDQAAAKNLIHKNKAGRLKSRLAKIIKDQPAAG